MIRSFSLLLGFCLLRCSESGFSSNTECGKTLGCFRECSGDCTFEVAWRDLSSKVELTIKADLPSVSSSGNWVSIGLSEDKKMGQDQVLDCITDGTDVFVQRSFNPDKWNEPRTPANPSWINSKVKSYSNGVLTCTFEVQKTNTENIDLNKNWFLLVARGSMKTSSNKNKHLTSPAISDTEVDFQTFDVVGSAPQNIMLKLHGCMMIAAWILCTSIGIVVARYYKPVWLEKKLLGEKVWFTIHRSVMILAVLFCIAGFVIIFVEKTTFVEVVSDSDFKKAHPFIGIIVMCLAIIQPVMAFCRPHPGDKNRFIFNWAHWFVGLCAHSLAVINIVIGVMLDAMDMPIWVVYIVVAYAVYQVLIELFLEVNSCFSKKKKPSQQYELKETNALQNSNDESSQYRFRKSVLGLHVVIIFAFTIVLIVMVSIDHRKQA